jgi:hypothetical protein
LDVSSILDNAKLLEYTFEYEIDWDINQILLNTGKKIAKKKLKEKKECLRIVINSVYKLDNRIIGLNLLLKKGKII